MPDNLDIEGAVYRDFKAYFEAPGEGLTAIAEIKELYEFVNNDEVVGTFIGVPFTEPAIKTQSAKMNASGRHRTTLTILTRTYAPDDKQLTTLRAQSKAIKELMNRENLADTLTALSVDQTYKAVLEGSQQPENIGKLRGHSFTYTIIHKVSK